MDDKFFIEGIVNRDSKIFDIVFTYYYSGMCSLANRYLNNSVQAEDVVQDVFVNLWTKGDQIKIHSSLKAYFTGAVSNKCIDLLKHRKVVREYEAHQMHTSIKHQTYSLYVETELEENINKALKKLQPRCREIFEKSRFYGVSNQDIATELSISKRTVELQISNALKVLRKELSSLLPLWLVLYLLK